MKRRTVMTGLAGALLGNTLTANTVKASQQDLDVAGELSKIWLSVNFLMLFKNYPEARRQSEQLYVLARYSDRWNKHADAFLLASVLVQTTPESESAAYCKACMAVLACFAASLTYGDLTENIRMIALSGHGALTSDAASPGLLNNSQRSWAATVGLAFCGVAFGPDRKLWAQTCLAGIRKYGVDQVMVSDRNGSTKRMIAAGTAAAGDFKDAAAQYETLLAAYGGTFDRPEEQRAANLQGLAGVMFGSTTIDGEAGCVISMGTNEERGIELLERSRRATLTGSIPGVNASASAISLEKELVDQGIVVVQPMCSCAGAFALVSRRGPKGKIIRSAAFDAYNNSLELYFFLLGGKALFLTAKDGLAPTYQKVRKGAGKKGQAALFGYVEKASLSAEVVAGHVIRTALEHAKIGPDEDVLIVLPGSLAFLPIGLSRPSATAPALCEQFRVRFADSLRTAVNCARSAKTANPSVAVLTSDPPSSDLQFLPFESASVKGGFPAGRQRQVVSAEDPKLAFEGLDGTGYWHVASHASWNLKNPERSGIALTKKRAATVPDILALSLKQPPRLVYLSACETGILDVHKHLNAFVNLPTAFLAVGASGAIGALWAISDAATSLLATRFYELHINGKLQPSAALKQAQKWLAGSTASQLRIYVDDRARGGSVPLGDAAPLSAFLVDMSSESCPFSHPYYWGGFQMYGA